MLKAFAIDIHLIGACLHNISDVEIDGCLADLGVTDEEDILTPTGRHFRAQILVPIARYGSLISAYGQPQKQT